MSDADAPTHSIGLVFTHLNPQCLKLKFTEFMEYFCVLLPAISSLEAKTHDFLATLI